MDKVAILGLGLMGGALLAGLAPGCHTPGGGQVARGSEYLIQVTRVEYATDAQEPTWSASSVIVTNELTTLCGRSGAKVLKFAPLRLHAGETTEVNQQKIIHYVSQFAKDGKPLAYEDRGVGPRSKASLQLVSTDPVSVEVGVDIEETRLEEWHTYHAENNKISFKQPFFSSRCLNSKLVVALGEIVAEGGLISNRPGEKPVRCTWLIQVTTNEPSTSLAAKTKQ